MTLFTDQQAKHLLNKQNNTIFQLKSDKVRDAQCSKTYLSNEQRCQIDDGKRYKLKIYLAQLAPIVGNLQYNFDLMLHHYSQALKNECDLCIFPELALSGYIPMDLLHKPSFINLIESYNSKLIAESKNTLLLIPTVKQENEKLYNCVIAAQFGTLQGITYKHHLANYGVFDEKRYFTSGKAYTFSCNGITIGVPICEDLWFKSISQQLKDQGAKLLIVPNGSPFEIEKFEQRIEVASQRFKEVGIPIIYCNQALGQDGIIYDGRSFGYDGSLKFELNGFSEDSKVIEYIEGIIKSCVEAPVRSYSPYDIIYSAMVLGVRDYMRLNGFKKALIGLSGGMDSALVAAIVVDALGAENVKTVMLESQFTSAQSIADAKLTADLLKVEHHHLKIDDVVEAAAIKINGLSSLAHENLQARTRGMLLMAISNSENRLLIATSNKSESAVGYTTLYGDMCGAFNPIKDLYKTEVYKVAGFRNQNLPTAINVKSLNIHIIPENIFMKAPSAELRANQKDSDNLMEYVYLDEMLNAYIEQDLHPQDFIERFADKDNVLKAIELIKKAEYKRRQAPPGVKLTNKAFDLDRRYPLTNGWNY